ncbi:MAG: hemolysin family protein [Terriglobales bacterium]
MLILVITGFVLLSVLTLASYVERIYAEMGKFLSREFQENVEAFEKKVEPRLGGRERVQITMSVLAQLATAGIAMLVAYSVFRDPHWTATDVAEAAAVLVIVVILFNRILPFVLFTRTKGEWLGDFVPLLRLMIYASLPVTMVLSFALSVAALAEEHAPEAPEHPSEVVDALIEAGQEEGTLQETDPQLIHSVVEFGEKTVREVMTPRPEIVTVPLDTTVDQFVELLRAKPYSRVPVYEGSLDNIQGVVFAHDVLQMSDAEARTRTVRGLMRAVPFVPESKRVGTLLRELQKNNMHMAIVIDEYGGVAGVATIEDLVEEIVGEIRDEHEAKADLVREPDGAVVVPGNMDVDRLVELFGVRREAYAATTVAGLVSEMLGRIPAQGESVEDEQLRFEILESTGRRILRLRIRPRKAPAAQPK